MKAFNCWIAKHGIFDPTKLFAIIAAAHLPFIGAADAAPAYYEMTVHNNFGPGEYYGVTPQNSEIWLLTNFAFDYKNTSNSWVTGNAAAGTYATSIRLSDISSDAGSIRLKPVDGGSRMYAILGGATAPTQADIATRPNNYFEWSFPSGNPGSIDLSWIDSWDFATRMDVTTTGSQFPGTAGQTTFGASSARSGQQISDAINSYVSDPKYAWLAPTTGFSETLTYAGTTSTPIRWITKTHDATVDASVITSFTNALTRVGAQAALPTTPAWVAGSPGDGPNWTTAGFRIASLQPLAPPDGSTLPVASTSSMWSAYVNFAESSGNFTMTLTDFTIWGTPTGSPSTPYEQLWNAVTDAGGAQYSIDQNSNSVLNAIWTSSANGITNQPTWFNNLGPNKDNLFYALFNGIVSGILFSDKFVDGDTLPTWTGYVPWTAGQDHYNFEILTHGAQISGGLAGQYTGNDLVNIMELDFTNGFLVSPYFLELLKSMQQTSAYLHPSQDFWGYTSVGSNTNIGIQPTPLNGDAVFGDATLNWYLGTNVIPEPGMATPLLFLGAAFFAWRMRRRGHC
jgi:hypothetical protein